jgi:hypothetical protein
VLLEEIKTVQGTWDHLADPLHWAQAKCYGFIYARSQALDDLVIQLTHLELATGKVTELRQSFSFAELSDFFGATTAIYLDWLRERHQWCQGRDQSIRALAFPFPAYRPGQRDLAVAAYRVLANGGRLFQRCFQCITTGWPRPKMPADSLVGVANAVNSKSFCLYES